MARVQFTADAEHFVPALGRVVQPDEVVEVDDDAYESFVPAPEHRSPDHPWAGIDAPDTTQLRGKALNDALKDRGLPTSGSADEKRQRLADALAQDTEEN